MAEKLLVADVDAIDSHLGRLVEGPSSSRGIDQSVQALKWPVAKRATDELSPTETGEGGSRPEK